MLGVICELKLSAWSLSLSDATKAGHVLLAAGSSNETVMLTRSMACASCAGVQRMFIPYKPRLFASSITDGYYHRKAVRG